MRVRSGADHRGARRGRQDERDPEHPVRARQGSARESDQGRAPGQHARHRQQHLGDREPGTVCVVTRMPDQRRHRHQKCGDCQPQRPEPIRQLARPADGERRQRRTGEYAEQGRVGVPTVVVRDRPAHGRPGEQQGSPATDSQPAGGVRELPHPGRSHLGKPDTRS